MHRRTFVSKTVQGAVGAALVGPVPAPVPTPRVRGLEYANRELPRGLRRTQAGLEPYTGPWTALEAAHLLRRTMFGARANDIDRVVALGMSDAVDLLLADTPAPYPPLVSKDETYRDTQGNTVTVLKAGDVWVTAAYNGFVDNQRIQSLQSWWIGLMIDQDLSIREKMTLFWHNHFVSEALDVSDARFMYKQNALLRASALGNVKNLVRDVTLDPAMLRYLNGDTNTKNRPNENYARELQELFTIGKGPEIAPGNYTTYTEDDVETAARVLTGWTDDRSAIDTGFTANNHDTTDKTFSAAYGGRTIAGGGGGADQVRANALRELGEMIDMIFDQDATALQFCRKLYRWFVYYAIDEDAERNVIVPLAALFRSSGWDVKPVVATLLKSAHFFDAVNMGCVIKNPIDHVIGAVRVTGIPMPTDMPAQYAVWNYFRNTAAQAQLNLLGAPNVAGWPAYYQEPVYYEIWLNSDTIPKRFTFTDAMTNGYSVTVSTNPTVRYSLKIDVAAFAGVVSDPSDPNALVREWAALLFPFGVSDTMKDELKKALVVENQDYDWTNLWNAFLADPVSNRKPVEDKLKSLLKSMLVMAEYQLS